MDFQLAAHAFMVSVLVLAKAGVPKTAKTKAAVMIKRKMAPFV